MRAMRPSGQHRAVSHSNARQARRHAGASRSARRRGSVKPAAKRVPDSAIISLRPEYQACPLTRTRDKRFDSRSGRAGKRPDEASRPTRRVFRNCRRPSCSPLDAASAMRAVTPLPVGERSIWSVGENTEIMARPAVMRAGRDVVGQDRAVEEAEIGLAADARSVCRHGCGFEMAVAAFTSSASGVSISDRPMRAGGQDGIEGAAKGDVDPSPSPRPGTSTDMVQTHWRG